MFSYKRLSNTLFISKTSDTQYTVSTLFPHEEINSWEENKLTYFFLPSNMKDYEYYVESTRSLFRDIYIALLSPSHLSWNSPLLIHGIYIQFMHSSNIPSLFISIDSNDFNNMLMDKSQKQNATIRIVTETGVTQYNNQLEFIKGRGNSTWTFDKRPFAFKLKDSYPLLGMTNSQDWILISNVYEGTKLATKITLEIAANMSFEYVPQVKWVDLYINNNYYGNYLLSEKIEIKENKLNIPNGILIEKDHIDNYNEEDNGFITSRGYPFVIKSPNTSSESIKKLSENINLIDSLFLSHNSFVYNYIDEQTFADKYILEEVALNNDTNCTSAYFYSKGDNSMLYTGPPWDYDGCYGEGKGIWHNYTYSITQMPSLRKEKGLALDWFTLMLETDYGFNIAKASYLRYLPLYEDYLYHTIDDYASIISDSIKMDMIRWDYGKNESGYYYDYKNSIRYLKYFLYNRLQYLNDYFNISYELASPNYTTGEYHTVTILGPNTSTSFTIKDGECISRNRIESLNYGTWYEYTRDDSSFSEYLPVYEDVEIIGYIP